VWLVEAETADAVWQIAASEFREGRRFRKQDGRGGATWEAVPVTFIIRNPRERWVVSRMPPINPAFAIAETIWVLNGRSDLSFLDYWNPAYKRFTGTNPHVHGAYGHRFKVHFGLDQLERAFAAFRSDRDSRQVLLQVWDPRIDLPNADGSPTSGDTPCAICSLLKVRDGRLHWTQVMRSNDLFRGVPYDFVLFTTLQEMMAGWLALEVGSYEHLSDSLHVYERDADAVHGIDPVAPVVNTDRFALPFGESQQVFTELARRIEMFAAPGLSAPELEGLASLCAPDPYRNLLLVMAAESARRRGWDGINRKLMGQCTNPALAEAWNRWALRLDEKRART